MRCHQMACHQSRPEHPCHQSPERSRQSRSTGTLPRRSLIGRTFGELKAPGQPAPDEAQKHDPRAARAGTRRSQPHRAARPQEAVSSSMSMSRSRSGFSDCAERTNPHTGDWARPGTSSPARVATAPLVINTSRELEKRSSASHSCTSPSACWVSWCAKATTSDSPRRSSLSIAAIPSAPQPTSTTSGSEAPSSRAAANASKSRCATIGHPAPIKDLASSESSPPNTANSTAGGCTGIEAAPSPP